MVMSMQLISENLKHYKCVCQFTNIVSSKQINNAKRLKKDAEFDMNTIYIIRVSKAAEMCPPDGPFPENALIIVDNRYLWRSYRGLFHKNIIMIHGSFTEYEVYSDVQSIILDFNRWAAGLYDRSIQGKGLQSLLDEAHQSFNNPMLVLDDNLKVLASSAGDGFDGVFWTETNKLGFAIFPEQGAKNVMKDYLMHLRNKDDDFFYKSELLPYSFYARKIKMNGTLIGVIHIIQKSHMITEGEKDALELIASLTAIEIQKQDWMRANKGISHGSIINDLIQNNVTSTPKLKKRLALLNWNIKEFFHVMVLKPRDEYLLERHLMELREYIIVPFTKGIIYEESIVLIINREKPEPFTEEAREALLSFLKTKDFSAGLSQCSKDIMDVHRLYKQAIKALDIGSLVHINKYIHPYANYQLYDSLLTLASGRNLEGLYLDSLTQLDRYDESHSTDFAQTLKVYIDNKYNQLKTSRDLFINRGTLGYRLGRIGDIMGISLDDNTTLLHLQLSFFIREYMSKTDPDKSVLKQTQ